MEKCRNFLELIDMGVICKLFFNPDEILSVDDLINQGLITQVGMVPFVREWWDKCDTYYFELDKSDLDNPKYRLK